MLATSCSNDEVVRVAPQSGAIGFNSFVGNSTRTDYGSNDSELTAFNVYGVTWGTVDPFQVFSGVKVEKKETEQYNSLWSYVTEDEPLRYWIPGNTYTFAAVAPIDAIATAAASGKAVVTQGTEKTNGGISKIQFTNDGNVDLLFDAKDAPNANATVNFELKHLLSRVKFQLKNMMESDLYYIEVKDVKINKVVKDATYTVATTPAWDVTDRTDFGFDIAYEGPKHTANTAVATSASHNLIPEVDAEYEATFTIVLYQDVDGKYTQVHKDYVHTVTLPKVGYKAGNSYLFAADITPSNIDPEGPELTPIIFSATVKDWEEENATLPTQKVENTEVTD